MKMVGTHDFESVPDTQTRNIVTANIRLFAKLHDQDEKSRDSRHLFKWKLDMRRYANGLFILAGIYCTLQFNPSIAAFVTQ